MISASLCKNITRFIIIILFDSLNELYLKKNAKEKLIWCQVFMFSIKFKKSMPNLHIESNHPFI